MVFHKLKILPLLVIAATLALVLRMGETVVHIPQYLQANAQEPSDSGQSATSSVTGAMKETNSVTDDRLPHDLSALESGAGGDGGQNAPGQGNVPDQPQETDSGTDQDGGMQASSSPIGDIDLKGGKKWPDATDAQLNYSDVRMELFEDLSKRREQLNAREKRLKQRKALLKAAEQELDRKYQELKNLRTEIKGLLKKQSEESEERINSLVKIYEGMKSDDAARIFNTLDMNVLVDVMSRMSERKLAPILAEMNAERARSVTMILARQKQLSSIPGQTSQNN